MNMAEFERLVQGATARIPGRFKAVLKKEGIQVLAREKPPPAARGRKGALTFGMFIGTPYGERSQFDCALEPTRIELYKESFEKAFGDPEEVERQVALTVSHEVGHYFGFSEGELRGLLE